VTYSVGIDMGGTFTDGYFSDGEITVASKVPTTHFDLTRAVMSCLAGGAEAFDVSLEDFLGGIGLFRLATTIGTNAVVTGTGEPVGLMVEVGSEKSLYGPGEPAPAVGVFVDADHVVGVAPGAATEDVLALCRDLVQQGVRQTVVSLRGANRAAETELRDLVADRYPVHYLRSMPLTLGWETAEVPDDDLRTSTAVLNAYLSRPMAKLLYRTEGILQQAGLAVPLLATRSDGTFSRMPRTTAISTYSSGPAAGLGLVAAEARRHGDAVVVGFDMGGTTLDLGLVRDGSYQVDETPEIRGVRVKLPVPGIVSVGLGGSSIASVSDSGTVTVGPASAGAVPGPAAFGRGGTEPTLTDADVVLGLLADGEELPGDIVLDAEQAAAALAPLAGGDPAAAARLVHSTAHAKAAAAIGEMLASAGVDPAEATLYAFGGAGGLHAGAVAGQAGISRVRSFAAGGVFSARGVAEAAVEQHYESVFEPGEDPAEVMRRLVARARLDLEAERLPIAGAAITVGLHHESGHRRSAVAGDEASGLLAESDSTDPIVRVEVRSNWQQEDLEGVYDAASSVSGDEVVGPALANIAAAVHAIPAGWTARPDGADSLLWERSR
jgi:N-methylhydantoinase A/oxoprolinase/acetone carboxylase beta subunit